MAIINDDPSQFNPLDSVNKLTQNDIDFLCKNFQIWHDFFFGESNDDDTLLQQNPFTFSGVCCITSNNRAYGGEAVVLNGYSSDTAHLLYSCTFDGDNCYYGELQPVYAQKTLNQTTQQGQINLGKLMANCNNTASQMQFSCVRKDSTLTDFWDDRCLAGFPNYQSIKFIMPVSWRIFKAHNQGVVADIYYASGATNRTYYNLFTNQWDYGYSNTVIKHETSDTLCFDFSGAVAYIDENATPGSGYYKNFGSGNVLSSAGTRLIRPYIGAGALVTNVNTNNVSNSFINSISNQSTYNNTYNYTTNEGDTITVKYGDNYIITDTQDKPISYIELQLILDHIIDDLSINVEGFTDDNEISVPTFQEIKYEDRGSLYIGKWNEYPKNLAPRPVAVDTISNDIASSGDVLPEWTATVGTILSTGVNGFMSLLPDWIGILLGACFLTAFLARNMRKGG